MIEEYLEYLKNVRNYSSHTISSYESDLLSWSEYLDNKKINYLHVNKDEILGYLKYLDDNKYTNTSIARQIASFRGFYKYLEDNKYISTNPFLRIHNPKLKRKLPNTLNYEEIRKLLDDVELKTPRDYMEHAIFELLYASGIRVSELVNLEEKNIDFKEMTIRVLGKGNKERTIYLNKACVRAIHEYLDVRPKDGIKTDKLNSRKALFLSERRERISKRTVQHIVDKELMAAGLDTKKYSTHKLRHTAATLMYQYGNVDIRALQEVLGHESISTTEIYTHVANKQARDAIENNPLANI